MEINIKEENVKRYRVTIVEEVEAEIEWDYLSGHNASGLKVGDKVKIIRAYKTNEGGCELSWNGELSEFIGETFEIKQDDNEYGFIFGSGGNFCNFWFPYFVLEKVEEPAKKEVKSYEDVLDELNINVSAWEYELSAIKSMFSEEELKSIKANMKLKIVARYLNEIEFKDVEWDNSYYIAYQELIKEISIIFIPLSFYDGTTRFKSEKAAQRAIEILGEETIKMALK